MRQRLSLTVQYRLSQHDRSDPEAKAGGLCGRSGGRARGGTSAYQVDLKEALDKALARLPEIQRNAVLLRDYEGYSYEEIGEILELTESQVKVYIFGRGQL